MWKDIEDNKKCLEMWEKDAECRDRKKTFKQMVKVRGVKSIHIHYSSRSIDTRV